MKIFLIKQPLLSKLDISDIKNGIDTVSKDIKKKLNIQKGCSGLTKYHDMCLIPDMEDLDSVVLFCRDRIGLDFEYRNIDKGDIILFDGKYHQLTKNGYSVYSLDNEFLYHKNSNILKQIKKCTSNRYFYDDMFRAKDTYEIISEFNLNDVIKHTAIVKNRVTPLYEHENIKNIITINGLDLNANRSHLLIAKNTGATCCYCNSKIEKGYFVKSKNKKGEPIGDTFMQLRVGNGETNDQIVTIEHLKPKSKGGGSNLKNLRLCCRDCNNTRDDLNLPSIDNLIE